MQQYLNFLNTILTQGTQRQDRTGTGTIGIFGYQMRFDLSHSFPLLTTKKLYFKGIVHELLWLLSGDTNIRYLQENNVKIWNAWADAAGNLGPVYGKQWRAWQCPDGKTVDQISLVIEQIKNNPYSRRHIVSAWNPADLPEMALPPCHLLFQFHVAEGRLSCMLTQRSADAFLGVPFNIASYALLTRMMAQQTDLEAGELIWSGGDCHIYANHVEQVKTQLQREPYPLPSLEIKRKPEDIFSYQFEDFALINYQSHAAIKAPIAV